MLLPPLQVRDLEVAYDRRFLRGGHASPADAHGHEPDAIVGLHIAAGVGLRVVVRKQLAARLFPRLLDDSQGGAGAIVWVDDGAVAALSATGHESLGGDMAGQLLAQLMKRAQTSCCRLALPQRCLIDRDGD